jgi:influenza virus NS1A-binding protein
MFLLYFTGKIYVVGGNDGTSALNSTEIYDPETHTWTLGPTLVTHRANCGVAVLGDKLFATGGFNGKKFLNSMEFLDLRKSEYWRMDMPGCEENGTDGIHNQNGTNGSCSDDGSQNGGMFMEAGDVNSNVTEAVISGEKGKKHGSEVNGDLNHDTMSDIKTKS